MTASKKVAVVTNIGCVQVFSLDSGVHKMQCGGESITKKEVCPVKCSGVKK